MFALKVRSFFLFSFFTHLIVIDEGALAADDTITGK